MTGALNHVILARAAYSQTYPHIVFDSFISRFVFFIIMCGFRYVSRGYLYFVDFFFIGLGFVTEVLVPMWGGATREILGKESESPMLSAKMKNFSSRLQYFLAAGFSTKS